MFIFAQLVMNHVYKGKAKYILVSTVMMLCISITSVKANREYGLPPFDKSLTSFSHKALHDKAQNHLIPLFNERDTVPVTPKSSGDSILKVNKIDTFNIKYSSDSLDGPVVYHADDSMVFDVPGKKIMLYGKEARTKYLDNELTAPGIEFDQRTNLITASLRKDSAGKVISFPTFNQADFKSISDTIQFNMKSGKGLTKGTYTQQGEMYVYGEKIKKIDASIFYAYKGRFTTCNLDTPHFAFVSKRIKFINKKMAITGPVHPEFEGVPVPVILPFGLYPLSQGRHSGLIAPAFSANEQYGLSLEGLGYYKVINDNWDITARGTLYSYGGWTLNLSPRYYKRYHYRGSFSLDMQRFKSNFKGDPDYTSSRTFNVRWSHSSDTKARPGVTFNANVNAGSTKFNELVPNSPNRNFSNQLNSTISYNKVWKEFNIALNASHSQNTNQKTISVSLPDVSFNLNTQYPFRRKEAVGKLKWFENIGIALNSNVRSQTFFSDDTAISKLNIGKQIFDNYKWGGNHNIPISLSLPQIGPFQISPSISYVERWYQERFRRTWNSTSRKVDTTIKNGFFTARDMSFGLSIATRIFGMFTFGKKSKIKAIRHEIRPSIGINYKPDMNGKYFYATQIDTSGRNARFSLYERSLYGAFGEGRFGGMSFNIDNNISMKIRDKKDTTADATKKVTLIDGWSLGGSYNFLADSFALSVFNMSARSNLFEKINITATATFDPYQVNSSGDRINKLIWRKKALTLGRLIGGNVSMSTSFQGGDKSKKPKTPGQGMPYNTNTGMPLDEYQTEAALISNNPAEYADFSIPWSISLSYSLRFQRERTADLVSYKTNFYQDVNWTGTVNLSPKWQLGLNGFYNITGKELGTISMSIAREMHCWQMAINVSPVGKYRFFNLTINPKSALLRDLRINRTRYFFDF
ncbi:MAG: putative LPS assembly protein LptD [Ferruginibacter sp.]